MSRVVWSFDPGWTGFTLLEYLVIRWSAAIAELDAHHSEAWADGLTFGNCAPAGSTSRCLSETDDFCIISMYSYHNCIIMHLHHHTNFEDWLGSKECNSPGWSWLRELTFNLMRRLGWQSGIQNSLARKVIEDCAVKRWLRHVQPTRTRAPKKHYSQNPPWLAASPWSRRVLNSQNHRLETSHQGLTDQCQVRLQKLRGLNNRETDPRKNNDARDSGIILGSFKD